MPTRTRDSVNADTSNQTLEQVDGLVWPDPPPDATRVMKTVHTLRRKPIRLFTAEDLRVMLGQREGISVLLPRALDVLERDPLAEGDYYPGDLLVAALKIPEGEWAANPNLVTRLRAVIDQLTQRDDLDIYFPSDDEIWSRITELKSSDIL
ncbi:MULTISPECIES: contact-dependent growth inhibition system immunity protein [unclassified Nocardia]|uniref:contact-dependent growth inhibition system immunity protein n=1 Tax=unclassified Nocardia TaxID=2637762 RepID=UPI001CE44BD3|nr:MULTISPECIES: contact-dependent growth inhibition system immunity protein [unclassified Nocardia]